MTQNWFRARIESLLPSHHEAAINLNQAHVAVRDGNFDLASSIARQVLEAKPISKKTRLSAEFVVIQAKSRQGQFIGVLDQLDALYRKISKRDFGLQARVGNEIVWVCHRSGNLALGADRGEALLRESSAYWSPADTVELLCQVSSCHYRRGDAPRAEELVRRALELAEKSASAKALAQTQWQSSVFLSDRGDLALAMEKVRDAKKWAEIAGMNNVISSLNHNAAVILLQLPHADLDFVQKLAESSYLDASTQNFSSGAAFACEILSEVALRRGEFELALSYAKKGLAEMPIEIPGPRVSLLVQVAKVLARMNNPKVAETELAAAALEMEKEEPSRELAKQWGDIARVYVEVGLADRGVYAYEKAIQISGLLREEQDSYVG